MTNTSTKAREQSTSAPSRVEIVRAALGAHTADEAAAVNDMIALTFGGTRDERFVADRAQNLGLLTTPGEPDQKALEPITNMHDSLLELRARQVYGDLDRVAASTPREAVSELLGHLDGRGQAELARVDVFEAESPARRTKRVTIAYRDQGCGLTPEYIPESIFHAGSAHKDAYPWMSGAFGMGGTTCYPHTQSVVLVTRRHPHLLADGEPDVVAVAVAEWQQHAKGRGIYYLVDPDTKLPMTVPARDVPEFTPGAYLALVSYETKGLHTGRNDRNSLEFLINTRLWDAPLPVRLMNHVATGDHPKDHHGRRRLFVTPRADRLDMHAEMPFRLDGVTHRIPLDIHYFKAGPSSDRGGMRNFIAANHAVLFVANGQAHKHWTQTELKQRADRLPKLFDRMLVVAYLDEIPVAVRTGRLFTPDRVDLTKTEDANRLQDALAALLNSDEELRQINNDLVRTALENRSEGRSTLRIAERIKSQMAFKGGFRLGGGGGGEDESGRPRKTWAQGDLWPDPTTLEGPGRLTVVPGKTRFAYFHINAQDDFFSSGRGRLELSCDHDRIGEAELVAGTELHHGLVRVSLLVPEDVDPGTATITARVTDWMKAAGGLGDDLRWDTQLEILDADADVERRKHQKPKRGGTGPAKGPLVALVWRGGDSFKDHWHGGVPGHVELVEASVLAELPDYIQLAHLGSELVPTIYLNEDYTPLKKYEQGRARTKSDSALDRSRDNYAVAAGVGLLLLHERDVKRLKRGEPEPEDTIAERDAVARTALANATDMDRLALEVGLDAA